MSDSEEKRLQYLFGEGPNDAISKIIKKPEINNEKKQPKKDAVVEKIYSLTLKKIEEKVDLDKDKLSDKQKVVHNESVKLVATSVNNVSTAFFVAGGVAPLVALSTVGLSELQALLSLIWILTGFVLHSFARLVLGSLEP